MPYIPNRQLSEHLPLQANSLLQLLVQLTRPTHGVLIASPDGLVLAANAAASLFSPASDAYKASRNLSDLLGIPSKKLTTQTSGKVATSSQRYTYTIKQVQFERAKFVYAELVPYEEEVSRVEIDDDSYHNVFENSTEPLFILDEEGTFVDINNKGLSIIDQQKSNLVGQTVYSSFKLNLFERVALKGQLQQTMAGEPQKFEWWIQDKTHELLPIEISLRKGLFKGQEMIFGSAKNLYEVVGTEQDVRFRNHQLEFVNNLITNLSNTGSQQDVLKYTLDELLEKSDITYGCVYTYNQATGTAELVYSAGSMEHTPLHPTLPISPELAAQLTTDRRRTIAELTRTLSKQFDHEMTIVPVTTDERLLALLMVWPEGGSNITQSFLSLLDFVGTAIGNYISRHELILQLSHSEDKYKMLFDSAYDAILLFKDGNVVDCNEKALQFFRCRREDLVSATPMDFSPEYQPDGSHSGEKTARLMEQVLTTGTPITFEWRNIRKDGTPADAEINLNRILIDGEYYVQAFKRDITQRKQALQAKRREEVAEESMAQFRDFLEKVNMIYYSLDVNGNIVFANDFFLKYVEYEREELFGQNFYELLVPKPEQKQRIQDFKNSLSTRHLNAYYERNLVTKSGQLKTIRWNCMLEYGPDGEVTGITSVGKDMTDKRIAMEALKDNKIRLQDLFDNAHDLIQNTSVDNKFIFVNKAWKERLGYNDEDIESLTLNDIVHPYYKAKLIYQLRNLYKGENVNKIETVFLTKAGKPVHLIGSITCSWQDDRPVATRAILHDITDRIKAERLQKVYYSIANLAISSKDLNSLYSAIHRELSKIIETRNIYIALCDQDYRFLNFVYLVDQYIDKTSQSHPRRPFSRGLSEYIIETGKPLYMQQQELLDLAQRENLSIQGAIPEVILCSPLAIGDRIIGVITLQDYQNPDAYVHTDIEILHFISNQVALAIERKRNEEQINNQNAKLNAIFESGTHHMWTLNKNFELTSFNRNFAATFEKRTDRTLGLFDSLGESHLIDHHEFSFGFWQEKYTKAFAGNPQHFEVHLRDPESWREVFLNPIYLEDGTFEEVSAIALDITDKKKSQLALVQNEEKFRHIFESFQDIYYRTSLNGPLELVSPSVKQVLGYTEEEVLGKDITFLYVYPEERQRMQQFVKDQKIIRDYEIQMFRKDGTQITVLADARLMYDKDNKPVALEGVIRDVTELKRTQLELLQAKEEAENLLKAKTQFLANMSHELRTPMNGIIGMIDLLTHINTDPEQQEYIDTLRKSSDALLAILNDILDLSKIQAGKLVLHESSVDLHDTLGKIHSLFANRAQQKDLYFTYNISPETPRYVLTDETRLLQVLSNLTSNAIKFTNAGEVSITVDSQLLDKKTQEYMLHVRVKDSGIGISPEDQALLFTDFTQLDNSSTKTFGGTGLGLAISRQLTSIMGGEIGVESKANDGSTFWFKIRVHKAGEAAVAEQQLRLKELNAEVEVLKNSPYVLLVDDNQINQKVAQKQLERLNCRTDIASNGYEAIELATSNNYNIIFMDIQMPEMDGVTATKHIKGILEDDCPPIIAMTAYSMKDDADKFMGQGMDDYVSKPVKSKDLLTVINKWERSDWYAAETIEEPPVTTETIASEEEATDVDVQDIINKEVAEQLKQIGGEAFTIQLYEEFEQEAAELLEEAKKDLHAQHYKSILSTLHQLKGTGFTLGINKLAELAKLLEHDIKQEKFESVAENFEKLLEQYENYRKSYKEIII
ncbi:PAS domain S-box protein [Pontibacter sp. BT310]|uniref:histidine kinase n=1 Tax=Pontibacter populi TaxID=890055 RepID=A0ABS6X7G1_9BACT|nr:MULTISPECIES: PAS domain S-box protein [Pontibacter]MBJ6116725.1 PAS domain S-box protein [Pontibacter sp. BT310]MBR0569149.1 PAS domain S-box protein [Microvirga sp. STS03]MBW3363579.1 PAS domain S-box protein [Pontibacter populi]